MSTAPFKILKRCGAAPAWGVLLLLACAILRLGYAGESAGSSSGWALRPLLRPSIPILASTSHVENPIDAFIQSSLAAKGLSPSPEADRRTLIRRLYFDLIGLPPSPESIESFQSDPDPKAYAKQIDPLLASPQYGERWARHWLDVVHYGETHGYDKDQPRPNAWPYRDYVIRSFNDDKNYSRFVQEQVAGDVMFPDTRDGVEALGFIAAGPWDFIGHAEVPESKADGKIARHLDRDDMVANTFQTFNSLTVQCAQCHDHKFDPISQEDYYSAQAVFAAVDRTDKKYDIDPEVGRKRLELSDRRTRLLARKKELEDPIVSRAGKSLTDLEKKISQISKPSSKGEAYGYHSGIEKAQATEKWVQVDLGRSVALGSIVMHPCKDDFNQIGEGFGFPVRFRVELSDDDSFQIITATAANYLTEDYPNPKLRPVSIDIGGKSARYLRVTATRLALRQDDYIFALAELNALTADGNNVALGAAVTALDSIESGVRWQKANLTDGWQPGVGASNEPTLAALQKERLSLLAQVTSKAEQEAIAGLDIELESVKSESSKLPEQRAVYIAAVHSGTGAFAGTGSKGGQPRTIHVLRRGDVLQPGPEVGPGGLRCLPGLEARFESAAGQKEGERRAALARWLTHIHNPLTWRSLVNRVWQYHFGRGLVETPNDFGKMGALPSHPELLDWLAAEFRDGGQSLKSLHRLILTSATYRQSSSVKPGSALRQAQEIDAGNRLLWRQNRTKLEAEAVRDAVLLTAGKLDLTLGGPSFKDFVIEKQEHSPHYEYHLHDPEDPASHRRSVYRFLVRSQPQPFMSALDCADPSMLMSRRNESQSPLQAMALMNNALILAMSKHFAARLEQRSGDLASKVRRGFYEAAGRNPTSTEVDWLAEYAQENGLSNFCRLLFNLNEFLFVD